MGWSVQSLAESPSCQVARTAGDLGKGSQDRLVEGDEWAGGAEGELDEERVVHGQAGLDGTQERSLAERGRCDRLEPKPAREAESDGALSGSQHPGAHGHPQDVREFGFPMSRRAGSPVVRRTRALRERTLRSMERL